MLSYMNNANSAYVEEVYLQYKENPNSVDSEWKLFFEGFDFSLESHFSKTKKSSSSGENLDGSSFQVMKLIDAYRRKGHLLSDIYPIETNIFREVDLSLESFGLSGDLEREFDLGSDIVFRGKLKDIVSQLKDIYSSTVGMEFMHCRDDVRQFILEKVENSEFNEQYYSKEAKKKFLKDVSKATTFENFLHTRYVGKKRFSIEGVDSLVPLLNHMVDQTDTKEWILSMAHRGRLNTLVHVLEKPYKELFTEFEELPIVGHLGDGDVKYHMGYLLRRKNAHAQEVRLEMPYNPSHLETVDAVALGMTRARLQDHHQMKTDQVIPVVIHGDAAIAGQGIVYELINMAYVESTQVGGTIHIVTNNQVGFTANNWESRSSTYSTDVAKVIDAPVFHVNGDDIEKLNWIGELAVEIRQKFKIDVFIDIMGYRKYGHNEGDEPRFTQNKRYETVDQQETTRDIYGKKLVESGVIGEDYLKQIIEEQIDKMQGDLDEVKKGNSFFTPYQREGDLLDYSHGSEKDILSLDIKTEVSKAQLKKVGEVIGKSPETEIQIYRKTKKLIDQRGKVFKDGEKLDWAMGELLTYGSLLMDGYNVRIVGEDSQRGTFSHRQSMIVDTEDERKKYFPLQHIANIQGHFEIHNSILSEYAAMAYEYGFATSSPKSLVIWEAQFGDFVNGAQIVIDQYISAAESKWQLFNGLVLFLPHGYEGQGPEHSSARLERFLQLCAEGNMIVTNVTTPANLFHLLRRQMLMKYRKPLIVMTPKLLLRYPLAQSKIGDFIKGRFQTILDDLEVKAESVKKVFLCSGKIYYSALEKRRELKRKDVALVRLEQLYPLDKKALDVIKKKYTKALFYWLQEEPLNMGAWWFISMNIGQEYKLGVVSRKASASTAVGKNNRSNQEVEIILKEVFSK